MNITSNTFEVAKMESRLTEIELMIASNSDVINLGEAYPQFFMPEWMRSEILSIDQTMQSYRFIDRNTTSSYGEIPQLNLALLETACEYLHISKNHAQNGFVTFSDSISLLYCLSSQTAPFADSSVVTTNPSIDIVSSMLSRFTNTEIIYANCNDEFSIDPMVVASALRPNTKAIVITSPENPTGNVCDVNDVNVLVEIALKNDVTLIFDQCFASLNPFSIDIPLLPNHVDSDLKWIFIWGTGKTFGMSGEKLGLIFCSANVKQSIQNSMNVLQCEVSGRATKLFQTLLERAIENDYVTTISNLIATNYHFLSESLQPFSDFIKLRSFEAGSVALIDVSLLLSTELKNDEFLVEDILRSHNVGLIPARYFFYSVNGIEHKQASRFARIALARDPETFSEGVRRLVNALHTLRERSIGSS